jgi:lysophospholipase L1-like esterase
VIKVKILFQGDSITDCRRDRSDDLIKGYGYASMVTGRLNFEQPGAFQFQNRGIGGNRVLREYCQKDMSGYGVAGIKRFARDVTAAGVDRGFVLQGINDLLHPREGYKRCGMDELPTAEELIGGLQTYIDIAHRHGIKIYLGTIMPHEPFLTVEGDKETKRLRVNEWIRREAPCDGVIDFDAALRDPDNHSKLLPIYDSGDKLHPSFAGSKCMADSIPEEFIK